MSYDDKKMMAVSLGLYDFGADADEIMSFRLPTGYTAKLIKIGCMVTEAFACTNTAAMILVGTAADPNAYAQLEIADTTADADFFDETDDTNAIIAADIPADTLIQVTLVQSTDDSSDTGQGYPLFEFLLYKPGA